MTNEEAMEMQQLRQRNAELEAENKKLTAERSCPVLPVGTRVRLSENFKRVLVMTSPDHLTEFGGSVGVVEGLTDYGRGVRGPEVDVRWTVEGLRYAYPAAALEVVSD